MASPPVVLPRFPYKTTLPKMQSFILPFVGKTNLTKAFDHRLIKHLAIA